MSTAELANHGRTGWINRLRRWSGAQPTTSVVASSRVDGDSTVQSPTSESAQVSGPLPSDETILVQSEEVIAVPLVQPKAAPVQAGRRGRRSEPSPAADPIQSRLFSLLGDAQPDGQDFDTGAVLHKLFADPSEMDEVFALLAQPFIGADKKVTAVIGLGGYGSTLAFGVARVLPPYPFGENEVRPVAFLSIDRNCQEKGGNWRLASDRDAATLLRAKRVLFVAPVLTRATCADVQTCVKIVEESLGVNATVCGISALYQLQASDCLPKGRNKVFRVQSLLRLDFQAVSRTSA